MITPSKLFLFYIFDTAYFGNSSRTLAMNNIQRRLSTTLLFYLIKNRYSTPDGIAYGDKLLITNRWSTMKWKSYRCFCGGLSALVYLPSLFFRRYRIINSILLHHLRNTKKLHNLWVNSILCFFYTLTTLVKKSRLHRFRASLA